MSDPMANKSGREAPRGAEAKTLDYIFEVLTPQQWAELLRAPLERAAGQGNRELAQRLVRAGAQIGNALHQAIRGGDGDIASDLLESGASFAAKDTKGRTPLHLAAVQGQAEMVQLLLLKGADKDAVDDQEYTPLFLAAFLGHVGATLALLAAGANASLRCEFKTLASQLAAQEGHVEILRALIRHGADVDAVDTYQHTALHSAASANEAEAINVLVGVGANIEARGQHNRTPLHFAGSNHSREALHCLLKHGATVNAQNDFLETPLMIAAAFSGTRGVADMMDSLLRAGADETITDSDGKEAADVIGIGVGEEDRLAEDIERVRELLANAPADTAWRRRGYLVLCRAHPDRMQHNQMMISGIHHTDTPQSTRSRARLARSGRIAGDSAVDGSKFIGGDWAVVVSKVLLLQEEGIFRAIVGYL